MSDDIKTVSEVMREMREYRNSPKLVKDWKSMIPEGSRWHPGDPGNPSCKICEGTGYLRIEGLPVGHPYFGKIVFCDCTKGKIKAPEYDAGALRYPAYSG